MSHVKFRGKIVDARTAKQLAEAERILGFKLTLTQGSYSDTFGPSAGTHAGGGVVDISVGTWSSSTIRRVVRVLRTVGLWAWYRTRPEWSGARHIHAVSVGCEDLSPSAKAQIADARKGLNGLANDLPDRHAGLDLPVITWEHYEKQLRKDRKAAAAKKAAAKKPATKPRAKVVGEHVPHQPAELAPVEQLVYPEPTTTAVLIEDLAAPYIGIDPDLTEWTKTNTEEQPHVDTRQFVLDLAERAAKTFGQAFGAALAVGITGWLGNIGVADAATVGGAATGLSVLTSLLSKLTGNPGTASLVDQPEDA